MSKVFFRLRRAAGITGFLAASACAFGPITIQAQTVTAVMQGGLRSVDPVITTNYVVRNYGYMVYDTLLAFDADNHIQPQMLEKWNASSDGKTYTFVLRDGLKWHDGGPVTATDCVASIRRWAALDKMGQAMANVLEDMRVIDSRSFSMRFKEPTDVILRALAKPSGVPAFMMPERVAKTPVMEQIKDTVGSGPFRFVAAEYRPGVQAVFEKNRDYVPRSEAPSSLAGGKVVNVARVKWVTMPDTMTMVSALVNNEIDFVERAPYDLLPLIEKNKDIKFVVSPEQGGQPVVRFNFLYPPFDNKLIRQAVLAAVNQKDVLQAVVGNPKYYRTCLSVFGCGGQYESSAGAEGFLKGDIKKAAALLKEAHYDGAPVVLAYNTDTTSSPVMPVVADAMRKSGFNVDLQPMDLQSLQIRRASRKAPSDGGWNMFPTTIVLPDISDPLRNFTVSGNGNGAWFGWPDFPAIEKLRTRFAHTGNPQELKEIAEKIQKLALDEVVIVPLGQYSMVSATRKSLTDIVRAPVPVFWNMKKSTN